MQDSSAEDLKAMLDEHGIEAISTHAQLADLRSDPQATPAYFGRSRWAGTRHPWQVGPYRVSLIWS